MIKYLFAWIFPLILMASSTVAPAAPALTPAEAFGLKANALDAQTLRLTWQIAPDYWLIRDKLRIDSETDGVQLGSFDLPAASTWQADALGDIAVYRQNFTITVPIVENRYARKTITLAITAQGCPPAPAACYPSFRRTVTALLPATNPLISSEIKPATELPQAVPTTVAERKTNDSNDSKANAAEDEFLPPEQAFKLSTYLDGFELVAHWDIADDYYLYRDKLKFSATSEGHNLGAISLPPGTIKEDPLFGQVAVFYDELTVRLPLLTESSQTEFELLIGYQGCAEAGLCYPPISEPVTVALTNAVTASTLPVPTTDSVPPTSPPSQQGSFASLQDALSNFDSPLKQTSPSAAPNEFLPPDQAFALATLAPSREQLIVQWQIADGYYLYQDKFQFSVTPGQLGAPDYPPAVLKDDPLFGQVSVYQQTVLEIALPLTVAAEVDTVTLTLQYQGCAEAGLCYPPLDATVTLTLPPASQSALANNMTATVAPASATVPKQAEQDRIASMLMLDNIFYTLLMFFGFGLLLAFTPCVFPMIPILSSIIVGQRNVTTYSAFIMSLVYVLAMALTYALAGVFAGLVGESLQTALQTPSVAIVFALIFVALAFSMFGFYDLQLPNHWQSRLSELSNSQQGGTLIGVAIMGVLSALIVGPCVAAPLAGALIYIGQTQDGLLGGLALFSMGLGMGVPLLIIGTSAGRVLPKAGLWMNNIKAVFGVLLLAVAIWLISWLLPPTAVLLLWACLLIISAVFMGALDPIDPGAGWRKLWKGFGVVLLIYGTILIVGAAAGARNLWQPLTPFMTSNVPVMNSANPQTSDGHSVLPFQMIKGVDALNQALATAQGQPVMLDFYADWCVACKEMELFTFTDPQVQQALSDVILLQTDVTANDAADKALYQHFGIFGPPALIFFLPDGTEQRGYRVVGFMPAEAFYQHIQDFKQTL